MWWHDVSWVLSVDCFSVVVEFLLHFHFLRRGIFCFSQVSAILIFRRLERL